MGASSEDQVENASEFDLLVEDRLGILTATATVMGNARFLTLDAAATRALVEQWVRHPRPEQAGLDSLHFYDGTECTVNWVLVLDALNFCFWGELGQPRWCVEWHSQVLDGYHALAAALSRAIADGCRIWDAAYLAGMTRDDLAEILRPVENSPQIPLFEMRLANVREVGRVLLDRYNGQFASAVESAGQSAVSLVALLAREFPSFRDVAEWRGMPVPFLKRAQICVADLHSAFQGKTWGAFTDLDQLTAFADYKLPQLLRRYGALVYSEELAAEVDQMHSIEPGSEEEIEIRCATIWGVEWLRRELSKHGLTRPASTIDYQLWAESQTTTADTSPYHRTRTIYY